MNKIKNKNIPSIIPKNKQRDCLEVLGCHLGAGALALFLKMRWPPQYLSGLKN